MNPWNTRFYFQTKKDKTIALSLSDSSLETKLIQLYNKKIEDKEFSEAFPSLDSTDIPIDTSEIEKDFRINRMKGFLYGYYIGVLLSSDKDSVRNLTESKEILNIFSAIESSIEKQPTKYQHERLNILIPNIFRLNAYQYLIEICNSKNLIDWINEKINLQEFEENNKLLSPYESEVVIIDNELSKITSISDNLEQKLFKEWINTILTSKKYNGKIHSFRKELSDEITIKAKEILVNQWENSYTRNFLNKLRRHTRGENFDVEWNNGLLSSIAAIILKGDDWNKLLTFMQTKGMFDYRLAFSMYGALNGFANLTRDFTDNLYNRERKYVSEVYREFYSQLHGVTIAVPSSVESIKYNPEQNRTQESKHISSALKTTDSISTLNSSIIHEIWDYFKSPAFKGIKNKTKLEQGLRICIEKVSGNFNLQIFLSELSSLTEYGWNKNNKSWKLIQEKFCPDYKDNSSKKKKEKNIKEEGSSPSLFDSMIEGAKNFVQAVGLIPPIDKNKVMDNNNSSNHSLLLFDNSWIDKCASLIDDKDARKQFCVDIEWFIGYHQEIYRGNQTGVYKNYDTSNDKTIKRLQTYLERKLRPNDKYPALVEKYKKIPIGKIVQYLEKEYGIR